MNLTPELAMLYKQQLSQYDELKDLREKVRVAEQRYIAIGEEIGQELAKQIVKSAAQSPLADSTPPTPLAHRELGGGFGLTAFIQRGVAMMDTLEKVLNRLPHGDGV